MCQIRDIREFAKKGDTLSKIREDFEKQNLGYSSVGQKDHPTAKEGGSGRVPTPNRKFYEQAVPDTRLYTTHYVD